MLSYWFLSKVLSVLSFLSLLAAAAMYIYFKQEQGNEINFLLIVFLFSAVILRLVGMQFKLTILKKENIILKKDLKNLTSLLEKKSTT